jgi:hypothetical protein
MGFTLRLNFDGLLHYVENSDHSRDVQLCVVLPQAPKHIARIGEIDIDNKRVVLQFTTTSPKPFDFDGPVISGSLKGAVPLERIIPDLVDRDPEIVSAAPPPTAVRAQVLIAAGGTFQLAPTTSPPEVEMPDGSRIQLAEGFFMEVKDVDSARLLILPLADPDAMPVVVPVVPRSDDMAVLSLSQTCVATEVHVGDEDKDFRFQYLLLGTRPTGKILEGLPAPIIRKFSEGTGNFRGGEVSPFFEFKPHGCNCAGGHGKSRPFDLDAFMRIQPPAVVSASQPQSVRTGWGSRPD